VLRPAPPPEAETVPLESLAPRHRPGSRAPLILAGIALAAASLALLERPAPAHRRASAPAASPQRAKGELPAALRAAFERALAGAAGANEPLRLSSVDAVLGGELQGLREVLADADRMLALEQPPLDALEHAVRALPGDIDPARLAPADQARWVSVLAHRLLCWRRVAYLQSHRSAYHRGLAENRDPVLDVMFIREVVDDSSHWDRGGPHLEAYLTAAASAFSSWCSAPQSAAPLRALVEDLERVARAMLTIPGRAAPRMALSPRVNAFKRALVAGNDPVGYTVARLAHHAWELGFTPTAERAATLSRMRSEDLRLLAVQLPALSDALVRWADERHPVAANRNAAEVER
jgi:hypothetical protein